MRVSIPPWFDFAQCSTARCRLRSLLEAVSIPPWFDFAPAAKVNSMLPVLCFNPTLVRFCLEWELEEKELEACVSIPPWFDFAGGTHDVEVGSKATATFQSHLGSILPSVGAALVTLELETSFNPTLVRFCRAGGAYELPATAMWHQVSIPPWFDFAVPILKAFFRKSNDLATFQSHLGSILPRLSTQIDTQLQCTTVGFNPTLVRFCRSCKHSGEHRCRESSIGFNPTLVRFCLLSGERAQRLRRGSVSIPPWFDFANFSERTPSVMLTPSAFQSHLGSILPRCAVRTVPALKHWHKFQSHLGSILPRLLRRAPARGCDSWFQSHLGSILPPP
jgi:hypothetical protein